MSQKFYFIFLFPNSKSKFTPKNQGYGAQASYGAYGAAAGAGVASYGQSYGYGTQSPAQTASYGQTSAYEAHGAYGASAYGSPQADPNAGAYGSAPHQQQYGVMQNSGRGGQLATPY